MSATDRVAARFEQLWIWRQGGVWAPVVWFPAAVYALVSERTIWAIGLGLAGIFFAGVARGVLWLAHCPSCGQRFGVGFRRFWDEGRCAACDVSLFERRRERGA